MSTPNTDKRIENLRKANDESHRVIVESLREALYRLLETRDIRDIKVVDLIRLAGVSRGAFYKNYYLVTDVLADDIRAITEDVSAAMGTDIALNWHVILRTVHHHRDKIPLLLKAGMGMEMLGQINRSIDTMRDEEQALRVMAWNGIIFNCIQYWAARDFVDDPDELAESMAAITMPLFDEAASNATYPP
ncbi:MAG: hypothetical protein IKF14_12260 [Atopobiaceae bacterium]|nr:hypothetical protein [Atopobiaceae bacterium]